MEDMPEYQVGVWRSPYVKIYSIGGRNRIAEISNYPRAYKDLTPHVYTENTSFTVTEDDLNEVVEGEWLYRDSQDKLFTVGEKATHYAGDGLPGAFPLWIESDDLPFTATIDEHVFPLVDVAQPIRFVSEAALKDQTRYAKVSKSVLSDIQVKADTDAIRLPRKPKDVDKQIIRIRYRRVF